MDGGGAIAHGSQGGGSAANPVGKHEAAPGEEVSAPPLMTHVQKYFILSLLHQVTGPSGTGTGSVVSVLSPVALLAPVSG